MRKTAHRRLWICISLLALFFPICLQAEELKTSPARTRIEIATSSRHAYKVRMGGSLDGFNTRSPVGVFPYTVGFQPNIFVRMENVGDVAVKNPWLIVDGKRNLRSLKDIVAEATRGLESRREKAIALWNFHKNHRYHFSIYDTVENWDPVKVYNVYGFTLCDDDLVVLAQLFRQAGLENRKAHPFGHNAIEVFFDGAYHFFDGDLNVIALLRDNRTVASEEDLVADHDLMKRTHTHGAGAKDDRFRDEKVAAMFSYRAGRRGVYRNDLVRAVRNHTMDFTLVPGQALEWRWDNRGLYVKNKPPGLFSNGKLIYKPNLEDKTYRQGVHSSKNIKIVNVNGKRFITRRFSWRDAYIVFRLETPYPVVGLRTSARVEGPPASYAYVLYSGHHSSYMNSKRINPSAERVVVKGNLRPETSGWYSLYVRFEIPSGSDGKGIKISDILIEADLQMAPLSLPELQVGENEVLYTDETESEHKVQITHCWRESSSSRPPAPPAAPVYPPHRGTAEGADFAFRWEPAIDADADEIVDYHFQLSDRADFRWPLSPNFDKLISNTKDAGSAAYTLPYKGLLNPDERYYWRVRAKDSRGVWGKWSDGWSFTVKAPGVPLAVTIKKVDRERRTVSIGWKPNPWGRKPDYYKIYGSNERGFTASEKPREVFFSSVEKPNTKIFPANFVMKTEETGAIVVTPENNLPGMNRCFYRVSAVDENGNESGPSDYVEMPRPFICSVPERIARAGKEYSYQVRTISSIGDLTNKERGGNIYSFHFWNQDRPAFSIETDASWLTVDKYTGLVSGTPSPEDAGRHNVRVKVVIDGAGSDIQEFEIEVKER